jgi:phosphatidylserine decarboxylase
MGHSRPLPVWDRRTKKLTEEWLEDSKSTYETQPDRSVNQWFESHPLYDWGLATYYDTRLSVRAIEPFIRKHKIDMRDFEPVIYHSYADFFERRFLPGARTFPKEPREMGAFAEARYFGWDKLDERQRLPVKGHSLSPVELLGDARRAQPFEGGPVLLARLSPVDYHHVHYFDEGDTLFSDRLGGRLWTVNWRALLNKPEILFKNERQINILETRHFGRVAFIEVGALQVGRIVQIHRLDVPFQRAAEKSLFRFGGSAIVVFGQPGAWRPTDDILENTANNVETLVRLGDTIATATASEHAISKRAPGG